MLLDTNAHEVCTCMLKCVKWRSKRQDSTLCTELCEALLGNSECRHALCGATEKVHKAICSCCRFQLQTAITWHGKGLFPPLALPLFYRRTCLSTWCGLHLYLYICTVSSTCCCSLTGCRTLFSNNAFPLSPVFKPRKVRQVQRTYWRALCLFINGLTQFIVQPRVYKS